MAIKELYVAITNDGEVAVIIPFAKDRCVFDYQRTYTQRRVGMTEEQFREKFPRTENAKSEVFNKLGITEKELKAAVRRARSDSAKCQNLRQLVGHVHYKFTGEIVLAMLVPNVAEKHRRAHFESVLRRRAFQI